MRCLCYTNIKLERKGNRSRWLIASFKNYSDIRNFMRRFYVYGFEKRQDFTAKSSRSYDDNHRRLDSWLEDYMSFEADGDLPHFLRQQQYQS